MKIKDSSKLLADLLQKEYEEKILEIETKAKLQREQTLLSYKEKAMQDSKTINENALQKLKQELEQEFQTTLSEKELELTQKKEELYLKITNVLMQKIENLSVKEKQEIMNSLYSDMKTQTDKSFEIKVWKLLDVAEKKEYDDLKITAESKTQYIEDSITLRFEKYKEEAYKIIQQKIN